jgi:hypothetical protein
VHNAFNAVSIFYKGKWEGVGLGNLDFFGLQMALAYQKAQKSLLETKPFPL